MAKLIVDSACDLPYSLVKKFNIGILPANIHFDGQVIQDYRNPKQTVDLYIDGVLNKDHDSETQPTETQVIEDILSQHIENGETDLIIQTVSRVRSPMFDHSVDAASNVTRKMAHLKPTIKVQDSRTVLAGQGVLAAHTTALMNKGVKATKLRQAVDALSSKVHSYQIPKDVYYLRARARKKGDNSIGLFGAIIGRVIGMCPIVLALDDQTFPVQKVRGFHNATEILFNHAIEKVEAGLASPFICLSYAGAHSELDDMPVFNTLKSVIKAKKYQLLVTPMSLSGGVNLGPGTLSLAFATEPYDWD